MMGQLTRCRRGGRRQEELAMAFRADQRDAAGQAKTNAGKAPAPDFRSPIPQAVSARGRPARGLLHFTRTARRTLTITLLLARMPRQMPSPVRPRAATRASCRGRLAQQGDMTPGAGDQRGRHLQPQMAGRSERRPSIALQRAGAGWRQAH